MPCSDIPFDQNWRRLRKFLDFIQFEIGTKELEVKCNSFAQRGKGNVDWVINQIIGFCNSKSNELEGNR
jgi:hypothetical protein